MVEGVTLLQLLFKIREELSQFSMVESFPSNAINTTLDPCLYNSRVTLKLQMVNFTLKFAASEYLLNNTYRYSLAASFVLII